MTLSRGAKKALKEIGTACGKKCGRPYFMMEKGRYFLANNKEIAGAGIHELIDSRVFVPSEDGLFPGHSQTFVFDPSAAVA